MTLTHFTVQAPAPGYNGFASGAVVTADGVFREHFPRGGIAVATGETPPVGIVPAETPFKIINGVLCDASGSPGVRLKCDQAALGLSTTLQYEASFHNVDVSGKPSSIAGFTFNAQATDTPLNLLTVTPVASVVAVALGGLLSTQITDSTAVGRSVLTAADLAALWAVLGTVPTGNLPPLAIVDFLGTVASQSAMLALTGQKGDWCVRTDTSPGPSVFVITGNTPSSIGSWTGWAYPTVAVVDNADGTVSLTPSGGSTTNVMEPLTPAAAIQTTSATPAIGQITLYNATSGNLTPSLPALSGIAAGRRLAARRDPADVSTNTVTFATSSGDTFYSSGATSFTLPLSGEQREFQVVSVSSVKYWAPAGSLNPLPGLDARYQGFADTAATEMSIVFG